ncbi:MAG: DUF928 domain-containing protein [Leptolyngbyaceae cyanobacterium bins.59]|nr:DUF928 domain-containing protein [Leptolyngbyaceae cyanobacterium bins.59]
MRFLKTIQCVSVAFLLGAITAIDLAPMLTQASASVPTSETLIAQSRTSRTRRRLRFRVGVRPSKNRIAGFSRGFCPNQSKALAVAFAPPPRPEENIPPEQSQKKILTPGPVDMTLSDYPTFWFYIQSMPVKTPMQFTLQVPDPKALTRDRQIYTTRFEVGGTGLVGVQMPKTVEALKIGETYTWQMRIECTPGDPSGDVTLESWVQRVDPSRMQASPDFDPKAIVRKLTQAPEREKPFLYAELGVWQDAVTALIDLQRKQPNNQDLKENWRELLTQTQLDGFANAPILGVR